jgi:ribosome-associated translation inhibitor RaiA
MTIPVQITYRDFDHTDALDTFLHRHVEKLEALGGQVTSCRIALESPHRHKSHGRHYRVRIDISVPGATLLVDRAPDNRPQGEDAYSAIDDAFDHASRMLTEHTQRRRDIRR